MSFSIRSPFSKCALTCAAAAALAFASPGFADDSVKQTPFVTSVLGHFAAWDADHDGAIDKAEIDKLLFDPSIKGDDAAAVSALKLVTRGSKTKMPALTVEYFTAYNAKAIAVLAKETTADAVDATTATEGGGRDAGPTTKPIESPAKWDKYFVAGKKRLATAAGSQWSSSSFDLNKMKQGALGDCFFVASLGSVVCHRPEQIKSLVVQQPDGSYKASFPGIPAFSVPKLTDSQIAIAGTSGDGAFLAVFEQAYGKYRSVLKGGSLDVEGTDALYRGGDSAPTLQQLTGHATNRITFGKNLEDRAAEKDKVLPEVRELLVSNIQNHLAITGGGVIGVKRQKGMEGIESKSDKGTLPIVPPAVLQNHVYVITAFDPKTDLVTIWNPHGNTFKPKGTPGLENGYVTEGGKFTLPLTEAYQFYGSFTFETDKPAKTPTAKNADSTT